MDLLRYSVKCEFLSKKYKLLSSKHNQDEKCVLENVSFELRSGDVLGIIGANGSGKTTLLKILSGIVKPSSGKAVTYGTVQSIIEIGSEFNHELSGRDNIIMSASIRFALRKNELSNIAEQIIEFAEIGEYADEPLKNYSMGMYLRLAISMILFFPPDILIIDEVLSAGDSYFINKCYPILYKIIKSGTTLIFASHNLRDIQSLTDQCIWLEKGQIKMIGPSHEVVSLYQHYQEKAAESVLQTKEELVHTFKYSGQPINNTFLTAAYLVSQKHDEKSNGILDYDDGFSLQFDVNNPFESSSLGVTIYITDTQNQTILTASPNFFDSYNTAACVNGKYIVFLCHVPPRLLSIGAYYVNFSLFGENNEVIEHKKKLLAFCIECKNDKMREILERVPVKTTPNLQWELKTCVIDQHSQMS